MSISPGGTTPVAAGSDSDDSDDALPSDGVHVQHLPDKPISPLRTRRPRRGPNPWHRTSSFSSTSPSDDEYDSDATFRIPHERARLQQLHETAQLPSEIEHPAEADHSQGPLVEPIDSPVKRKHLSMEAPSTFDEFNTSYGFEDAPMLKRQRSDMPESMDTDMDEAHIASGPGWYEPEKDRIVVTSLSSPEHSRSPSPDTGPRRSGRAYSYAENKKLNQPGDSGFTISPSLLTHIIGAQKDVHVPMPMPQRELVLYRPIGQPGVGREDVVKHWDGEYVDSGRFEMIDDDEETMQPEVEVQMASEPVAEWTGPTWGADVNGNSTHAEPDGDIAMDMD